MSLFAKATCRILICVRGQCAESGQGKQLEQQLRQLIEQHHLDRNDHPRHTTCAITNCLGVCENGPVMIVHPDGVKYHHVDAAALERIFDQHILGGQPVEEYIHSRINLNISART